MNIKLVRLELGEVLQLFFLRKLSNFARDRKISALLFQNTCSLLTYSIKLKMCLKRRLLYSFADNAKLTWYVAENTKMTMGLIQILFLHTIKSPNASILNDDAHSLVL